MLSLFKKKNENKDEDPLIKIGALFIHAAKIDNNYTAKEKEIIKKAIKELGSNENDIEEIIKKSEELEVKSNQILDFTREVKSLDEESKIKIIEVLWNIIYSDDNSDIYEGNLMRRLNGLLYIDSKLAGDIKQKIKSKRKHK